MPRAPVAWREHHRAAFTLIEMLTVIAVIAILLSLTVGITRGVMERSQVARAKADLAALAMALERYKLQYGDYPWTPDTPPTGMPALGGGFAESYGAVLLFNALCGNLGPKCDAPLPTRGRSFVELSRFKLWFDDSRLPDPDNATPPELLDNWFEDPWGKWYYYVYKKSDTDTNWTSPSYLLYSHGPDGLCTIGDAEDSGLISDVDESLSINQDNLYAGRDT